MALPVWDDPDVAKVFAMIDGQMSITDEGLDAADAPLAKAFLNADQRLFSQDASKDDYVAACAAGVQAVERFSASTAVGWRKFITHTVGSDVSLMWDRFRNADEARIFAEWVTSTVSTNRWGPDGNSSPLGEVHSWCMGVAGESGGGTRVNPATGRFEAPTGDEARQFFHHSAK